MRRAASCGHPLQEIFEPRGARIVRVPIVMGRTQRSPRAAKDQKVRIARALVNRIEEIFFS
jgi:hypothetical protein